MTQGLASIVNNVRCMRRAVAGGAVFLLAACGGGGGSSGSPAEPVAQPLALTASNSPAVAADALDAVEGGATDATSALDLLKSYGPQHSIVASPRTALRSVMALVPLAPAATGLKAAFSETQACEGGGTVTFQGSVANPDTGLAAGDTLLISGSSCSYRDPADGMSYTLDGSVQLSVAGGFLPASTSYPVSATLAMQASQFRLRAGSQSMTINGDVRLELAETGPTSESLVASGTRLSYTFAVDGRSPRTVTWRSYRQSMVLAGQQVTLDVAGQVDSTGGPLGSTAYRYALSTPQPLVASALDGLVSSGRLRIDAQQSAMVLRFTGPGMLYLDLDLNGDGTFEQSRPATQAELEALY